MTDETVDCYNCGRPNPEWAQVCRSCGVALRHGEARIAPQGPFPTDRNSLISMAAVIGTILLAVLVGLFVSGLNPTGPTVGQVTPTPSPIASPSPSEPDASASPSPTDEPTPTPEPLRGTLVFGTGLDGEQVTGETDTFTRADTFAYALSVPGGVGGTPIRNEIERTSDPTEVVLTDELPVDPSDEAIAFNLGSASGFVDDWGPGEYMWRVYVGDELIAEAPFSLADG